MAYKIEYNAILVSSTTADLADEVFAENYLAYDTKTDHLKKGDGKTKFSELPIISSGEKGEKGDKGEPGEKGDAFVYEDFTPAQLVGLKGDPGSKIELRINNEVWEYRYEGEEEWTPVTVNTD